MSENYNAHSSSASKCFLTTQFMAYNGMPNQNSFKIPFILGNWLTFNTCTLVFQYPPVIVLTFCQFIVNWSRSVLVQFSHLYNEECSAKWFMFKKHPIVWYSLLLAVIIIYFMRIILVLVTWHVTENDNKEKNHGYACIRACNLCVKLYVCLFFKKVINIHRH